MQTIVNSNSYHFLRDYFLRKHTQNPIVGSNKILIIPLDGNVLVFFISFTIYANNMYRSFGKTTIGSANNITRFKYVKWINVV